MFLSVDPLADAPANIGTSPYAYVWNNPLKFIDPDGRHGESVDNEYRVYKKGGEIQRVEYVSDKGGDQTDYITEIDLDQVPYADAVTNYSIDVDIEYTSGPGNDWDQIENPTPGSREVHNKTPTIITGVLALLTGGRQNTVSATLGATTKRVASKTLRNKWSKHHDKPWPKEPNKLPDGSKNPYAGRNQSVSHKKAIRDGGTNKVDNIYPQPWKLHHEMHKRRGDFKRWAKQKKK